MLFSCSYVVEASTNPPADPHPPSTTPLRATPAGIHPPRAEPPCGFSPRGVCMFLRGRLDEEGGACDPSRIRAGAIYAPSRPAHARIADPLPSQGSRARVAADPTGLGLSAAASAAEHDTPSERAHPVSESDVSVSLEVGSLSGESSAVDGLSPVPSRAGGAAAGERDSKQWRF